jgi:hypothetical protein
MSINDSIGNSTIGSTAPTESAVEQGVSQGVGINQEQPAIGTPAFATRANKSGSEGLSKGKLPLLGGGLAVAVLFFIINGNCRPYAQKADSGKATVAATEAGRNEASQGKRHACYGYCAYRGTRQRGWPAWSG